MSAPAYLPLFGSDYLADTRHLSTEEHGAYLLLMIAAWRQDDCGLPCDDKKLARIVGLSPRKWMAMRDTILEFWSKRDGRIFQERLLKEWRFALQKSESNRENARKRWSTQGAENIESGQYDRTSDGNAPQPQPQEEEEPIGSPSLPETPKRAESRAVKLPADWHPILTPAAQRIVDEWPPGKFDHEVARFRDHAADKGRTSKDWQAAFRTWITKSDEWMKQNGNRNSQTDGRFAAGNRGPVDRRDGFLRSLDETIGRSGPG